MSNSLNSNIETLFSKMEKFISTKTVIGEAIHIGNIIILPVVDVTFGVGAGASAKGEDKDKDKGNNEVGAGGMGGKITPSALLVIIDGNVQLVNIKNQDSINKLIDMAPGLASKLNLDSLFGKKEKNDKKDKNEDDDYDVVTDKEY